MAMTMRTAGLGRAWARRPGGGALALLALLTWGEVRVLDRLLFSTPADYQFVLQNIAGILAGTPVWEAFQNRLLGPALIVALEATTGDRLQALQILGELTTIGANLLLFGLIRRRGGGNLDALLAVACFGLVRLLLTFKLEYPWDGIDILLFLVFGYWASTGRALLWLSPVLLAGTVNHETVLYIPLWYLLGFLDRSRPSRLPRREMVTAAITMAVMAALIVGLRRQLYLRRPDLPGQVFETMTPLVGNPIHLAHNLRQFFLDNWKTPHRAFVSAALAWALGLLIVNVLKHRRVRASVWSLCVIASIFVFGYVNETRLYLPLVSSWFAFAWPLGVRAAPAHDADGPIALSSRPSRTTLSARDT